MLNTKTIRERLHQSPFTPFRICLADGQRIAVQHPDFVALGGSVVLVTDRQDNIQRLELYTSLRSTTSAPKGATGNIKLNLETTLT